MCGKSSRTLSLVDLRETAWVEDDQTLLAVDEAGARCFFEGFLAPGRLGRAIRSSRGRFGVRAVSRKRRKVSLELAVPAGGATVDVHGSDGGALATARLDVGRRTISFVIEASRIQRGLNLFELRWIPSAAKPEARRRLTLCGGKMESLEGDPHLSSVEWDTEGDSLYMGPGCCVSFFLVPGPGARIKGEVDGVGSTASVVALGDGEDPRTLWVKPAFEERRSIDVAIGAWEGAPVLEIQLRVSPTGNGTTWREIRITDAKPSPAQIPQPEPPALPEAPPTNPMNVLIYLVDTVRRDHLEVYGYEKRTTPGLAGQIQEWVVWEDCQSLSSWTKPSTASLLTGLDPVAHGANTEANALYPEIPLVWEKLHESGYETAYLTTNGHVSAKWGFSRAVDCFQYLPARSWRPGFTLCADSLHLTFLNWLDGREQKDRPFFAYLHAMDPHIPYVPPEDLIPLFYPKGIPRLTQASAQYVNGLNCPVAAYASWIPRALAALYDAEIAGWERSFCGLLDSLRSRGLLEETVIILTSDHGEELGDHLGFSHGKTLYGEQLRVPLMARVPGSRGGRLSDPVDHRDIVDLLAWLLGGDDPLRWKPMTRPWRVSFLSRMNRQKARIERHGLAVIWNISPLDACGSVTDEMELFARDPLALSPATTERRVTARCCRSALMQWWRRRLRHTTLPAGLDKETEEMLKLLGYASEGDE